MKRATPFFKVCITALLLAASSVAQAAFIIFDDTDPDTITVTAGDFEGGLSVDAVLLTSGLGDSGSVTLADTGHSISGSWIDLGLSGGPTEILFALFGDPTGVTSGMEVTATTDGLTGTITGGFGGFFGGVYFFTGIATALQDGHTEFDGLPFLSIEFRSEAVPAPSSLLLLGSLLPLVAAMRRRRLPA